MTILRTLLRALASRIFRVGEIVYGLTCLLAASPWLLVLASVWGWERWQDRRTRQVRGQS